VKPAFFVKSTSLKTLFTCSLLALVVFVFYSSLYSFIYIGDRVIYDNLFEEIKGLTIYEAFILFRASTGSVEPLSFLSTFISSRLFLSSWFFQVILNCIVYLLLYCFLSLKKAPLFLYPLVFSNFYVLVFCLSADRQKLGFIFLLCSAISSVRWKKAIFFVLSILSHFQFAILLIASLAYQAALVSKKPFSQINSPSRLLVFSSVLAVVLCLALLSVQFMGLNTVYLTILGKLDRYTAGVSLSSAIAVLSVFFAVLLSFRPVVYADLAAILSVLPFMMFIRQGKILVILFMVLFFLWLSKKRCFSWFFFLPVLGYFSGRSWLLVSGIFDGGNPFLYLS